MVMNDSENIPGKKPDAVESGNEKTLKRVYETPDLIKLDALKDTYNGGPTFLDTGAFS
ncbi:MAG: hypothetical protein WC799_11685 [Desulfobacteraceae bacterium]|jgi:hypothetical protein